MIPKETYKILLGERINEMIEDSPKSREEIAQEVEVSRVTLSHWSKGRRSPTVIDFTRLSECCGKTVNLLGYLDEVGEVPEEIKNDVNNAILKIIELHNAIKKLNPDAPSNAVDLVLNKGLADIFLKTIH